MEEKKYVTEEELEAARQDVITFGGGHKKLSSRYGIAAIIVFLVLFVAGFTFAIVNDGSNENVVPAVIVCMVLFVGSGVLLALSSKHKAEYMKFLNPFNEMYKTKFLPMIFEETFEKVFAFEPQNGLSREIVKQSDIFPTFDYITTNDYLRACHNGVNFEYCDMRLQERHEERDSDGDTRTVIDDVFWGVFIIAEFDHFVDTPLFIRKGTGKGNVTTESPQFNENFSVKCESEIDALRILTPEMMDHILKIKAYCDSNISLAFFDDKIYFNTGSKKDFFEIAYSIELPISESRKGVDEDIAFIKGLLDLLAMRNLKSRSSRRQTTDADFEGHAVYQNELH